MKPEDIKKVLILGVGSMGTRIALQCALYGYDVTVYGRSENSIRKGERILNLGIDALKAQNYATEEQILEALSRITLTTDAVAAAADADIISESIAEDPEVKGELFAKFHSLCPARTIFTTNTSTLLPSSFAEATKRPAQFVALHFHGYVWASNVVDISPHPQMAPETIKIAEAFARSIDQIPIVMKKEYAGFLYNNMLLPLLFAAFTIAIDGAAVPRDIDRAWMGVSGMERGPFGIADRVGLDVTCHLTNLQAEKNNDEKIKKCVEYLKTYVDKGLLGLKSGQGFYHYPDPEFESPDFLSANLKE